MTRVKAPAARTPLRGRGRTLEVPATPVDQAHATLMRQLRAQGCPPLLLTAAADATWLRPADGPALVIAGMIIGELTRGAMLPVEAEAPPPAEAPTDGVGTLPAFPGLGGGGVVTSRGAGAAPEGQAPPLRALLPVLVALLGDLGLTPEARARLGILLVEGGGEPEVPVPARLPRAARDRAPAA